MIELSTHPLWQQRQQTVSTLRRLIARLHRGLQARWSVLRGEETPRSKSGSLVPDLNVHDLKAILAAARGLNGRYGSIDSTLLEAAAISRRLRVGELLALRWGDIDWTAGTVNVERVLQEGELAHPKCGTARQVRLAPHTRRSLRRHRASLDRRDVRDLVFPNPRGGGFLDARRLRHRLHVALERAGFPAIAIAHLPLAFKAPWWSRYL